MSRHVFLVGAQKSGTTTLHSILAQHPRVCEPPIKEPGYFVWSSLSDAAIEPMPFRFSVSARARSVLPVRTRKDYDRLFEGAQPDQWRLDSSVYYLPHAPAVELLRENFPRAKIIIVLRDPVDRTISAFRYARSKSVEWRADFDKVIDEELSGHRDHFMYSWRYIFCSQYESQVTRYIERFGPKNVLIIKFDELKQFPRTVAERCFAFLEIEKKEEIDVRPENVTVTEPVHRLAKIQSRLLLTPNPIKDTVKSMLPGVWRKQLGERLRATIPRQNEMEPISDATRARLADFLDDERRYYRSLFQ